MLSVDVNQHWTSCLRAQELCESRGGRPGLPSLIVLKATLNLNKHHTGRQAGRQAKEGREGQLRICTQAVPGTNHANLLQLGEF